MTNTSTFDDALRQRFKERHNLLVILGPTASGKTSLAVCLARRLGGEIISADSRQVYKGMDLGTGKDLQEYERGGASVAYHLIDILDPSEEFSVFAYQEHFYHSFQEIGERGNLPLMVGGTGFYMEAVLKEYRLQAVPKNNVLREALAGEDMEALRRIYFSLRPEAHNTTDILDRARVIRAIEIAEFNRGHYVEELTPTPLLPLVIGIRCNRDLLRQIITARLHARLKAGMIEEVKHLHESGVEWNRIDSFGLEYRYIGLHLQGKSSFEEMCRALNTRIHQFAKRQETWFRRMEKNGVKIHWIEEAEERAAIALIEGLIS